MSGIIIEVTFECAHCNQLISESLIEPGEKGVIYYFDCPLCLKQLGVLHDELFKRLYFTKAKGYYVATGLTYVFQCEMLLEDRPPELADREVADKAKDAVFGEDDLFLLPEQLRYVDRLPQAICLDDLANLNGGSSLQIGPNHFSNN
jgi:hypothetical protein